MGEVLMAMKEQIERIALLLYGAGWDDPERSVPLCSVALSDESVAYIRRERREKASAILAAAAPTPDEHERGIEAVVREIDSMAEGTRRCASRRETAERIIAAYLSATWGADG